LREELGIEIGAIDSIISVPWRYPDTTILLDAYRVLDYTGIPRGREGQALAWRRVDELAALPMPPPDQPIVNALRLPDHYAITPEPGRDDAAFLADVERVLSNGARLLQLRAKQIERSRLRELAVAARSLARARGALILINGDVDLALACGMDGMHMTSAELMSTTQRPLERDAWLATSCHTLAEIRKANELGVDFAVLGPVANTMSHDGEAPLGWDAFAELCSLAAFPVFALGGLRGDDLVRARAAGAQGIAGISAFFK
jgi:8-oxo-dGTP diphosphatase